jgi:hypothetical protein
MIELGATAVSAVVSAFTLKRIAKALRVDVSALIH